MKPLKNGTFIVKFPKKLAVALPGQRLTYFGQQVHKRFEKEFPVPPKRAKVFRSSQLDVEDYREHGQEQIVWNVEYKIEGLERSEL